jgi:hypothetical protein
MNSSFEFQFKYYYVDLETYQQFFLPARETAIQFPFNQPINIPLQAAGRQEKLSFYPIS